MDGARIGIVGRQTAKSLGDDTLHTEISGACRNLENAINDQQSLIEQLKQRLLPCLRGTDSNEAQVPAPSRMSDDRPISAPLAISLDEKLFRINAVNYELNKLINLIEL